MKIVASTRSLFCASLTLAGIGLIAAQANDGGTAYPVRLTDPVAPQSPPEVHQVRAYSDPRGFPAGYSLAFDTEVCIDQQCRMVRITMYWDALGYYQRLECPRDLPLTKKQHVPFVAEDYDKLDRILKDRESILGSQPLEVLVKPVREAVEPVPEAVEIDGWSGATPQTVKDAVVEDAAFTTWTMWHWANGEIVPQLQSLSRQRCTPAYLQHLLRSADRREVDFALKHVVEQGGGDEPFVEDVFHVLQTGDRQHVLLSLEFLTRAMRDKRRLHDQLIAAYGRMSTSYSPLIVEYFTAQPELPAETLEGLTGVLDQLPYFQIHLVLRLLDTRACFSSKVEANVAGLLEHQDFFIARRAAEHLMKQTLDPATQRKLDDFRAEHRDRL